MSIIAREASFGILLRGGTLSEGASLCHHSLGLCAMQSRGASPCTPITLHSSGPLMRASISVTPPKQWSLRSPACPLMLGTILSTFPVVLLFRYLLAPMDVLQIFTFHDTLVFYPSLLHVCRRLTLLYWVVKCWYNSTARHYFLQLLFTCPSSCGELLATLYLKSWGWGSLRYFWVFEGSYQWVLILLWFWDALLRLQLLSPTLSPVLGGRRILRSMLNRNAIAKGETVHPYQRLERNRVGRGLGDHPERKMQQKHELFLLLFQLLSVLVCLGW